MFVTLNRVYKKDGNVKSGPISVNVREIASVKPHNKLGKDVHRSTITLVNGTEIFVSDRFSTVLNQVGGSEDYFD